MAWDIIECVAWEEGIFLAVDHNVVPNVDKVKYMGIALHRILHCQSNNTKPNKLLAMAQIIQYHHGKIWAPITTNYLCLPLTKTSVFAQKNLLKG